MLKFWINFQTAITYHRIFCFTFSCPRPFFIYIQHKFFQDNLHIYSPNSLYKKAPSARDWCTSFSSPPSPATGGSDYMPQDLVLLLASMWFNKPFLSGQLLALKVFVEYSFPSCFQPCLYWKRLTIIAIVYGCRNSCEVLQTLPDLQSEDLSLKLDITVKYQDILSQDHYGFLNFNFLFCKII